MGVVIFLCFLEKCFGFLCFIFFYCEVNVRGIFLVVSCLIVFFYIVIRMLRELDRKFICKFFIRCFMGDVCILFFMKSYMFIYVLRCVFCVCIFMSMFLFFLIEFIKDRDWFLFVLCV